MPLSSEGNSRTFRQNFALAVLLAGVAGAVNASGFFVVGQHTSHMTGQVATVGEALSRGELSLATEALKVLLAFVLGAATATALLELTSARHRGRYTLALVVELLILAACGVWADNNPGVRAPRLIWALSFAMGLQNALVTRISGAVVRTTHLTGVLTDIGIELIGVLRTLLLRFRALFKGLGLREIAVPPMPDFHRAWLHLALVGAFLFGATTGPLLLWRTGGIALAIPAVGLLGLVVLDWMPGAVRLAPAAQPQFAKVDAAQREQAAR